MAVNNLRLIEGALLTTAAIPYYSSPAGIVTIIKKMAVTNISAAVQTVSVYLVPSGGSVGSAYAVAYAVSVPANGVPIEISGAENQVLMPGDYIAASCSAAADVNIIASGAQIQ